MRDDPALGRMDAMGALRRACRQSRALLVRPISVAAWLLIGVMAMLEAAAQGPAGFSYALASDARGFVAIWTPLNDDLMAVSALIMEQSGLFVLVSMPLLLFFFFVTVFLLWLGSHMQMAFLSAASAGSYRIGRHWAATSEDGHSLFLFRLTLAVLAFLVLVVLILISSLFVGDAREAGGGLPAAFQPVAQFLSWGGAAMAFLNAVLRNLCAPIMFRLKLSCLDSVRMLGALVMRYPKQLLLYAGIRLAWLALIWILWIVGGVGTCLIGFLPGVHHALFAPVYLFDRLFSLYLIDTVWPQEEAAFAPADAAAESWRASLNHPEEA